MTIVACALEHHTVPSSTGYRFLENIRAFPTTAAYDPREQAPFYAHYCNMRMWGNYAKKVGENYRQGWVATALVEPKAYHIDVIPMATAQGAAATLEDSRLSTIHAVTGLMTRAGAQGVPVGDEFLAAVADAISFSGALPEGLPEPTITLSEGGEITFAWRQAGHKRALAIFEGDGRFGYAIYKDGHYVPGETEVESASAAPADLISSLQP